MIPQEFINCDSDHHCDYPTSLKPVYFGMLSRILVLALSA